MRWVVAVAAIALFIGGAYPATSEGQGRVGHLEVHAKVIWVLERSETGEVLSTRPGRIDISAMDTDTSTSACPIPECEPSADRILASIDGNPKVSEGTFEADDALPGQAALFLPGGLSLLVVDGGEPGSASVGPPNSAGIAPTRDYVKWLNISPAFILNAYLESGNIQLTQAKE